MKKYICLSVATFSLVAFASPAPFPVFLKAGFSSVLEFEEAPSRVVLGDSQSFQVEKMDRSLAIRTLVPYATTNLFVYFKSKEPRLFILTASEEASPTYYKKFEEVVEKPKPTAKSPYPVVSSTSLRLITAQFDQKKDYLTVEIELSSDSKTILKPHWDWCRLTFNGKAIAPFKLWSERREVQKDSRVRARLIFAKPNLSRTLHGVSLVIPILGNPTALSVRLARRNT